MRRSQAVLLFVLLLLPDVARAAEGLTWRYEESFGERGRGRNELREPVSVALTGEGDVVVLDRDREAVVLFDRSGKWVRTIGKSAGEVELRRPSGLALDSEGRIWVADGGNHRVVVLNADGTLVRTIGSLGSREGRFRHPTSVAFDRSGRAYVADAGNDRIQVFSTGGEFLDSWSRLTGGRRDHLRKPEDLAYTDQGRGGLWVLNRGWNRLERFDLDGRWEESLSVPAGVEGAVEPVDVTVEPTYYRMFITDSAGRRVLALDHRGRLLGVVKAPEGETWAPRGTAVDRRFDLFAADAEGGRVLRYRVQ